MNIAEQIKAASIEIDPQTGKESFNWGTLFDDSDDKAIRIDQDVDNETTAFIFIDGSVLKIHNREITTYGSIE